MNEAITVVLNYIGDNSMLILSVVAVFILGSIAAIGELLSRYSTEPSHIFKFSGCRWYIVLNGLASLIAYWLICEYNISLGPFTEKEPGKILIAGIAAMVVLRSSIASIKSGDKTIEAGLAPLTQSFLNAANKSFDRQRSQDDLKIREIMKKVDFNKAATALPLTCLNLMQGLSQSEQDKLSKEVFELSQKAKEESNEVKAFNLGIIIARYTGNSLLEKAVKTLGPLIEVGNAHDSDRIALLDRQKKLEELKNIFKSSDTKKGE